MNLKRNRAFLKWAGGKYNLIPELIKHLPPGAELVEPFVGAGSVFLNTDYPSYALNDINADLIQLYQIVQHKADTFIADASSLFCDSANLRSSYLAFRQQFNSSTDPYQRALLFLYLNRHGYNGLCRYNLSGKFNVPFGSYKKPYFPEAELYYFAEKAQKARFSCLSYQQVFARLQPEAVVYCDPPYVPLSKTASFTSYARQGFNLDDQAQLANLAESAQRDGHSVLISNHDTTWTRKIYQQAALHSIQVGRSISQNGAGRGKVAELFALYPAIKPIPELPLPAELQRTITL
ncbi:Dam family site-specific DNA-(adenine-N6)-methyltransferase [Arsukibacterium indicum]|uniref:Dam family site-specific DNA-(Adenine-N6)-methyltransferase n=1 Tax=Arsukibacterium indicum TaxID=2848612 RepID=A0ABS6MMK2_9GAMM|nr:Dam family site-specific DNA-(adenine-N6)-methyltransferase [Arsukibacterium indicum]MBV2130038.1 Dam family site-specific DNA-(adenine-N6)-methyltransferase [Arsukibacterium indicum]